MWSIQVNPPGPEQGVEGGEGGGFGAQIDDLICPPHYLPVTVFSFSRPLSIVRGAVCVHTYARACGFVLVKTDSEMKRSTQAQMWN